MATDRALARTLRKGKTGILGHNTLVTYDHNLLTAILTDQVVEALPACYFLYVFTTHYNKDPYSRSISTAHC